MQQSHGSTEKLHENTVYAEVKRVFLVRLFTAHASTA